MRDPYFSEVNHLITRYKNCSVCPASIEEENGIDQLLQDTANSIHLLEESFWDGLLSFRNPEKKLSWFVKIQKMVSLFCDAIYQWRKQLMALFPIAKEHWMAKTAYFLTEIQSFLRALQKDLPTLFDFTQCISMYEQDLFLQQVPVHLKRLQKKWRQRSKADERLQQLSLLPLQQFADACPSHRLSYHCLSFLHDLLKELEGIEFFVCAEKDTLLLKECLIALNFNHPEFIRYSRDQILLSANISEDHFEQLDYLWVQQKQLRQIIPLPHGGYYHQSDSAIEVLDCFLENEINYRTRKIKPEIVVPKPSKQFVLLINIPNAVVAVFLKVLVETGVIKTNNITHLLKLIAPYLAGKKTDNPFPGNFRNEFYEMSLQHLNAVKDLLFVMIKWINARK